MKSRWIVLTLIVALLGSAWVSTPALAGGVRVGVGVYVGPGWYGRPYWGGPYWGGPYWGWRPYYWGPPAYYYPPTYSYPAPVVVQPAPQVYIERDPPPAAAPAPAPQQPSQWWYFCPGASAYYPYVKECAGGWQRVSPQPPS
jgi:hypothetical protein